jgi:hypothetical protein
MTATTVEQPEEQRVAASRRRVEERLAEVRDGLHEDLGYMPRGTSWVLPAIGLAVGFSLAVRAFRRRRLATGEGTQIAGGRREERLRR